MLRTPRGHTHRFQAYAGTSTPRNCRRDTWALRYGESGIAGETCGIRARARLAAHPGPNTSLARGVSWQLPKCVAITVVAASRPTAARAHINVSALPRRIGVVSRPDVNGGHGLDVVPRAGVTALGRQHYQCDCQALHGAPRLARSAKQHDADQLHGARKSHVVSSPRS